MAKTIQEEIHRLLNRACELGHINDEGDVEVRMNADGNAWISFNGKNRPFVFTVLPNWTKTDYQAVAGKYGREK